MLLLVGGTSAQYQGYQRQATQHCWVGAAAWLLLWTGHILLSWLWMWGTLNGEQPVAVERSLLCVSTDPGACAVLFICVACMSCCLCCTCVCVCVCCQQVGGVALAPPSASPPQQQQ
jgi:hypothetical protein